MTTKLSVSRKPRWPWIMLLLVLAGLTAGWFLARERTGATAAEGGPPGARPAGTPAGAPGAAGRRFGGESRVGTALAGLAELPVTVSALGTVTPIESVVVRSRVEGELRSLHFTEGQRVKKGDLLALIDPRAFEVELAQTQAAKLRNQALLTNAREDLNRYETLLKQDSIATQQVTNQQALVREYEAAIKADDASIAAAQLSLSYARITAPISGRVGLRQATPGNIVRASDTEGLLTITQEAPISVVFSLPAPELPAVRAAIAQRGGLAVEAWDRENRKVLSTGTLRILDNQIDVATGTVKARAMFENRDDVLFPNQFVNVRVRVDTVSGAVVVPVTAIQRSASGTFVYVVGDDLAVAMRPVTTGTLAGELQQVTDGVQTGERVVTDGVDRLRAGDKVKIDDAPPAGARTGRPDAAPPGRREVAPAR